MLDYIKRVRETPVVSAAETSEGPVAVEGIAEARKLVHSPLLGQRVVGYHIYAVALTSDGNRLDFNFARANDFVVRDGSGSIEVRAYNARMFLKHEYEHASTTLDASTFDIFRALQQECGADLSGVVVDAFYWHAYFLSQGERCYVCGDCRHVVDTTREAIHYRESARKPTLRGSREQPLIIADRDRGELLAVLTGE